MTQKISTDEEVDKIADSILKRTHSQKEEKLCLIPFPFPIPLFIPLTVDFISKNFSTKSPNFSFKGNQ